MGGAWVRTRIAEAERNRPADAGPPAELSPALVAGTQLLRHFVAGGADPSAIAGQVLDRIQKRFYLLTHPELNGSIATRFEDILSGGPPRRPELTWPA